MTYSEPPKNFSKDGTPSSLRTSLERSKRRANVLTVIWFIAAALFVLALFVLHGNLDEEVRGLQERVRETEREVDERLDGLESRIDRFRENFEAFEDELRDDVEDFRREDIERLRGELRGEVEDFRDTVQYQRMNLFSRMDGFREHLEGLEGELEDLDQRRLQNAEEAIERLQADLNGKVPENEFEQLRSQVRDISNTREEFERLQAQVSDISGDRVTEQELEALRNEFDEVDRNMATQEDLEELRLRIERLQE